MIKKTSFETVRRSTVTVTVGQVGIGGDNPVRIQTMVTTQASNIAATVEACIKVADAGAELVRIAVPTAKDAEALGVVRTELRNRGYHIPLIADIHFNPDLADIAARNVEKIRINPGNFTDKQASLQGVVDFEQTWDKDLERLRTRFTTLLNVCKEHGTALRIGANHGSLSGRIMSRYGDTPEGMVESAMEFLRICKDEQFEQVVVSMKASNTRVMVQAYRLLIVAMDAEDMRFPLHLGVTEAGDGEDGRIKSAVGIGSLLADGLGDTIRVSLTEAPENEIPVARMLVEHFSAIRQYASCPKYKYEADSIGINAVSNRAVIVISDLSHLNPIYQSDIDSLGFGTHTSEPVADYIYTDSSMKLFDAEELKIIDSYDYHFIRCELSMFNRKFMEWLNENPDIVLLISLDDVADISEPRSLFRLFRENGVTNQVVLTRKYLENDFERLQIMAACDFGTLFIDGFGDGIMLSAPNIAPKTVSDLCFRILQAARVRHTRTEYIACPGCGRTLFDLQDTLHKIKLATSEFTNLKIGVMGCIVNGPGEMADADYGYVGAGPGKVTLYKGKQAVKRNIPQEDAIEELIKLIND
jgi:(E)-4-hydroxy-3-methylbut-2-enyl-diphosphate synthase